MTRQRRRPRRPAKLWWSAVAIALCAAAGSLFWGAFVLTPKTQAESWTAWAFKGAVSVLLASYLIEPLIRHLQTGRRSNFHPRFRSAKRAFQGVLIAITASLFADAYRDGILKSLDSIGEWGSTSILLGLISYAWLRAIGAPYNEASNRADWFAVLGVLGFSLIGVALHVNRTNSNLIPGMAWSDHFDVRAWIDQTVNQWAFRTVLWSFIGRLGVWIPSRAASVKPAARLMLAAFATGIILEVLHAVGMFLYPSLAMQYFNTSRVKALFHPVFITLFWCVGIWLVTPRNLEQTQAPIADIVPTARPPLGHGTRLAILGIAVIVVALSARVFFSPISYTDPRIEFFTSNDPSPDPYGIHNLLTASSPGNASAKLYVHALVTLFHAPGQRLRTIPTQCDLVDSTRNFLMESKKLLVGIPDTVSGPRLYPKTSWIALIARGPWKPGSYRVDCKLPRVGVVDSFAMR